MNKEKMVTIPQSEYESILRDSVFLSYLEVCGVDNWCGYSEAHQMMEEDSE